MRQTPLSSAIRIEHGWAFKGEHFVQPSDDLPILLKPGNFRTSGGLNTGYGRSQCYTGDYPEEYELTPGDLLVVMTCQTQGGEILGVPAFIPKDGRTYLHNQRLGKVVRRPDAEVDLRFIYWLLADPQMRGRLAATATGSTVLHTSPTRICELSVWLPTLAEQRRIAGVLTALNDKIEHARILAQRLSVMTATAAGRLFERASTEGWANDAIGERVSVYGGATPSTKEPRFWDGNTAFATPKDLADLDIPVLLSTERTITEEGVARVSSGTLPRGTLLLSSRAPIGYLAIAELPVAVNQGFIAMVCDKGLSNHYVMEWARRSHDVIVAAANGTTFLEISKRAFRPLTIPVPPEDAHAEFADLAECLHQRRVAELREGASLAAIRDTLLPKLVSGQILVPDSYDPDDVLGTVAEAAGVAAS